MSVQRQFFWIILSLYLGISSTAFAGSKRDEDVEKYIVRIGRGDVTDTCVVYRTKTYPGPEREWEQQVNKSVYFAGWNGYRDGDVVTVWVQKIGSRASSAIVRPERNNIGALKTFGEANERRVVFKVSNPTKISVEFDDDPKNNEPLLIFIGREEASGGLGSTAGKKYVYTDSLALSKLPKEISSVFFGPGRHAVGLWKVPTNVREIFIQEGAVLQGYIYAERADNNPLIIRGGGIISNEGFKYHFPSNANIADYESSQNWYKAIQIEGGKGHLIEGITIIDPSSYIIQLHASDSIISNVKMLGFRMNNDAVTLSGKNNKIEDCFIRVNDDAIVLRDVQGLTVKNCVFWQLTVGSIFQLGWTAHDISDLTVENCDVIHADWNYEMENSGFINLMAARASGKPAVLQNLTIRNIHFDTPVNKFVSIAPNRKKVIDDPMLGRSAPWIFKDVLFKDIHLKSVRGARFAIIQISGFSKKESSEDITFDSLSIDGELITEKSFFDHPLIKVENVRNLKISPSVINH